MKKLLFIENNRSKLDKGNVVTNHARLEKKGFFKSMPIRYITIEDAQEKMEGIKLYRPVVEKIKKRTNLSVENFQIKMEAIDQSHWAEFDGICLDGQHRIIAMMLPELKNVQPEYCQVTKEEVEDGLLQYVVSCNNVKAWTNKDFQKSGLKANNNEIDQIMTKVDEGYELGFVASIYTLDTINIGYRIIKTLQEGVHDISYFKNLHLNTETQKNGDKLLNAINEIQCLTKEVLSGRFGKGIKIFYNKVHNLETVINAIKKIDKSLWESWKSNGNGKSLEAKFFCDRLVELSKKND